MIIPYYCLFDIVAKESGPIFAAVNGEVAKRMAKHHLSQVQDKSDFRMVRIGSYDSESCTFDPAEEVRMEPVE